ncbi:UNVERIFIED_CONTAM: hypothetical protein K2H54_067629 [Gekko kuhli]
MGSRGVMSDHLSNAIRVFQCPWISSKLITHHLWRKRFLDNQDLRKKLDEKTLTPNLMIFPIYEPAMVYR